MASPDHATQGSFFPSTHWSMIDRARGAGDGDALGAFLSRYMPALRAHAVHTRHIRPHEADDLVQAFCLEKVMRGRIISDADRSRGRFRNFLLKVFDNFVITQHRREKTRRHSPDQGVVPLVEGQVRSNDDGADTFDVAWARQVIAQALRKVEEQCQQDNRPDVWGVLSQRVLEPLFGDKPAPPYETLVESLGFTSPAQASNALVTAKRMLMRALRDVVAEYARDEREIEEELAELRDVLSRRRG